MATRVGINGFGRIGVLPDPLPAQRPAAKKPAPPSGRATSRLEERTEGLVGINNHHSFDRSTDLSKATA